MISCGWSDIKNFIDTRKVSLQFVEFDNCYELRAIDGPFFLSMRMDKSPSDTTDLDDFEDNYKDSGNMDVTTKVVTDVSGELLTMLPDGFAMSAAADDDTVYDYKFPVAMALRGAEIYTEGGQIEDWVEGFIIDKDDVLGMGGTPSDPTILQMYAKKIMIVPGGNIVIANSRSSALIPEGLYLRCVYHNTDTIAAKCAVNLLSYVK